MPEQTGWIVDTNPGNIPGRRIVVVRDEEDLDMILRDHHLTEELLDSWCVR